MRRTVRKWAVPRWAVLRWAVLGIAGTLAVAGCGSSAPSWWRPGSAVLYSNTRVTSSQLASESANLSTWYQTYKPKLGAQLSYQSADIPRQVLTWMLRVAAINRLAANEHINVTPAQAQRMLGKYQSLLKQQNATLREFAVSLGLPPDMLPQFGRLLAIQTDLENRLDHGTPPAQGTAAFTQLNLTVSHLQCVAAKDLNIQVNPQYGAFDYSRFLVVPLTSELPSGQSRAASASLAPHC